VAARFKKMRAMLAHLATTLALKCPRVCENAQRAGPVGASRHALLGTLRPPALLNLTPPCHPPQPPFGMPHVNPTIETWGAGDYSKPYVINEVVPVAICA